MILSKQPDFLTFVLECPMPPASKNSKTAWHTPNPRAEDWWNIVRPQIAEQMRIQCGNVGWKHADAALRVKISVFETGVEVRLEPVSLFVDLKKRRADVDNMAVTIMDALKVKIPKGVKKDSPLGKKLMVQLAQRVPMIDDHQVVHVDARLFLEADEAPKSQRGTSMEPVCSAPVPKKKIRKPLAKKTKKWIRCDQVY